LAQLDEGSPEAMDETLPHVEEERVRDEGKRVGRAVDRAEASEDVLDELVHGGNSKDFKCRRWRRVG